MRVSCDGWCLGDGTGSNFICVEHTVAVCIMIECSRPPFCGGLCEIEAVKAIARVCDEKRDKCNVHTVA